MDAGPALFSDIGKKAKGSYAIDANTILKGRLNNHGKLGTLLQHEQKSKSVVTISGEFDTKQMEKNPRSTEGAWSVGAKFFVLTETKGYRDIVFIRTPRPEPY